MSFTCPVCGWPELSQSWEVNRNAAIPETCPCCAFEFGDDGNTEDARWRWRWNWIADGKPFRKQDVASVPPDWDPLAQLSALTDLEYPAPIGGTFACPVCGYPDLEDPPCSESGGGSYEICPSCGFEFGFTDEASGYTFEAWRAKWVADGMRWDAAGSQQPDGWDPRAQLASLLDRGDEPSR